MKNYFLKFVMMTAIFSLWLFSGLSDNHIFMASVAKAGGEGIGNNEIFGSCPIMNFQDDVVLGNVIIISGIVFPEAMIDYSLTDIDKASIVGRVFADVNGKFLIREDLDELRSGPVVVVVMAGDGQIECDKIVSTVTNTKVDNFSGLVSLPQADVDFDQNIPNVIDRNNSLPKSGASPIWWVFASGLLGRVYFIRKRMKKTKITEFKGLDIFGKIF